MNSYVWLICLLCLHVLTSVESARKGKRIYRKPAHENKRKYFKKVPLARPVKGLAVAPSRPEAEVVPRTHNRYAELLPTVDKSTDKAAQLQSEALIDLVAIEQSITNNKHTLPVTKYELPVMQALPVLSGLPIITSLPEVNIRPLPIPNNVKPNIEKLSGTNLSHLNGHEVKYEIIDVNQLRNNPILHKWLRFEEVKRKLFH
ncbi:uncharacterized protein LOC131855238 [Achroia grisella]|uniref:uncharacterized protein LOC131855238 n=1 Tax=Achroia grisella TaxID=688607 RepID=UPI0027D33996|nr:uncharacterized protein LOC131855238 [Achroia grisella]